MQAAARGWVERGRMYRELRRHSLTALPETLWPDVDFHCCFDVIKHNGWKGQYLRVLGLAEEGVYSAGLQ